ncbi:hypothetical protein, partial [Virgisporangium aliadipatigenens]|uniref:hypothetical protein n=1 Tax=Virgisporangium aliadipatigenens TaxID=741659 RepID=UPI0019421C29
ADVTVTILVRVFADHFPGSSPRPSACPKCGHRYPDDKSECPTMSVVRPQLYRRRTENPAALQALTGEQFESLHKPKTVRTNRFTVRTGRSAPCPEPVIEPSLLDLLNGKDTTS